MASVTSERLRIPLKPHHCRVADIKLCRLLAEAVCVWTICSEMLLDGDLYCYTVMSDHFTVTPWQQFQNVWSSAVLTWSSWHINHWDTSGW